MQKMEKAILEKDFAAFASLTMQVGLSSSPFNKTLNSSLRVGMLLLSSSLLCGWLVAFLWKLFPERKHV